MALSKLAVHKLIPPGSSDPRLDVVDGVVLHVAAGTSSSLHDYFDGPSGGIESHFYVLFDGTIEQYRDTQYEADAQLDGNSWRGADGKLHGLVSIETQGLGPGTWTDAQINSIKRLLTELAGEHGFPLRKIDAWNGRGVGYHTMWGAPSHWTPVSKTCPGPERITQFNHVLVPWFAKGIDKMDPASYFLGATGPHVRWLGERLVAHGFDKHGDPDGYQPGDTFTAYDRANVRAAQIAHGVSTENATGYPGRVLLVALARPPKPTGPLEAARGQLRDARDTLAPAAKQDNRPKAKKALTLARKALKVLRGK